MSFRDTFTRSSSSSQNLQYDDIAAYHFLTTMLLLVMLPLSYSIIKKFLSPFSHVPKLKQIQHMPQFKKKVQRYKKQNRWKFVNFWFVFKCLLVIAMAVSLVYCVQVVWEDGGQMKGFDPYEILQVQPDASVQKIKKSYRKLALKYHPDRNQDDPQSNAKFIMISKAYQCLTDQKAKQNCLKFGNPEGSSSFNVGIALPSFLIKKQNQVVIMGIVFVLVVIILPIFLIYYFGQVNKYDEYGMLQESHPYVNSMINQQIGIKDCVKVLAVCAQFKNLKISKSQIQKLQILLKNSEEDYTKLFLKRNFPNFIKKSIVLIDARVNQKKVPQQLLEDHKFILRKVPILMKSTIMMAYQRSNQIIARFRPEIFVGANALSNLIMFNQYFIQGKSFDSQSFQQLDLTDDQLSQIYKKKKKRTLSLTQMINNEQQKQFFLSMLPPQRVGQISTNLSYLPQIKQVSTIIHTSGTKQLTTTDNIQIIVNITANRPSSFAMTSSYPFLKMENWYLMVTDRNYVVHLEQFNFDKNGKHQAKFYRGMYRQPGNYSVTIKIMSDSYYGIDFEKVEKFVVRAAQKVIQKQKAHEQQQEQDEGLIGRWMKSMMPQEQQQLSDRQDQAASGKKSKKTLQSGKKKPEQQQGQTSTEQVNNVEQKGIQLQEKNQ